MSYNKDYDRLTEISKDLLAKAVLRELKQDLITALYGDPESYKPPPFLKRLRIKWNNLIWRIQFAWRVLRTGECGCDDHWEDW